MALLARLYHLSGGGVFGCCTVCVVKCLWGSVFVWWCVFVGLF